MKVSVTQTNLAKVLNQVIKATAAKPNIPVLSNVLIKTEKSKIQFCATNLEIAISAWIGGDVLEEGSLTVNARLLTEFVNQLKSTTVELSQAGSDLVVKSVDNRAQLYIIPAEEFPTLLVPAGEPDLVLPGVELSKAIDRTVIATAADQSRPVLTGLLLEATKSKASLVGVDGFRLARKTLKLTSSNGEDRKEIIPAKSMLEVSHLIADSSGKDLQVKVHFMKDKNQVLFSVGDIVLSTRLIDGEFPNYQQIIPSESVATFTANKSDFDDAVKIINIFSRNVLGYKTLFKLDTTEKKLMLQAKVQDVGNNETKTPLSSVTGEDVETAFNSKYLSDMVGAITGDQILFESNGVTAPGVFKDSEDEDYLHIVMPMRVE